MLMWKYIDLLEQTQSISINAEYKWFYLSERISVGQLQIFVGIHGIPVK